ncbi:uncharacterized protein PODANS_5_11160 [Podospora anserina S mat+]|uniref:Podospora anserina S mat+ genomic DNA chromosome 5, supercontig 10 n=1 Tax=Podospora anserina (strain S / ATCC MYA-4624 / DSM 980 / FGSC 10383) TaxID=515849 RepID=B2APQ3_PODAN|nr:uncharacterized protein PODANS_5_11160 [Podospora anserina S mat+]CAP65919.1 unnamed protein product [Podospora anserina S mat+]CDP30218.1 Putative protein of unknown function [Podospora anserina S mat+]
MVHGLLQPKQIESLEKAYSQLEVPNARVQVNQDHDGVTTFYFNAGAGTDTNGCIFQTHSASTTASILHMAQTNGAEIQQANVDVLSAKANVKVETVAGVLVYYGADAGVYLADAEAGPFHGTLGLAADTKIGCRDQSVGWKVLGCGVRVGRVYKISALGSGFGIDFRKFKWR